MRKSQQLTQQLREIRDDNDITNSYIAKKLQVSPSAISTRFSSKRGCHVDALNDLAEVLGYELILRKKNDN